MALPTATRKARFYYNIAPASLVAIVMLNFLLIYLNLVNLQNQSLILEEIAENTEIGLNNQELGLNISNVNQDMLESILQIQAKANETIQNLNTHMHQTNETLMKLNLSSSSLSP
jgi:hypothetical protein